MNVAELSEITSKATEISFGTDDIVSLFMCSTGGVVNLHDKQHIVVSLIYLLQLIGSEMGKMDPLFECVPELKGSVQEYTKCGELDEIDTAMMLVKFSDYFTLQIREDGIKLCAKIEPILAHGRYWVSGKPDMFSSVEFCADFWQILLKTLDSETIRNYIKINGFTIENWRRQNGFVGLLHISWQLEDRYQLISVDVIPTIVCDNLSRYTATLRPRHHDNKEVGDEFYQALELSSSRKDWDFLKFLQPEVLCAYTLVKILRSLAKTFQSDQGRVYKAEDILPSYLIKTSLLWVLDPDEKFSGIYKNVTRHKIFDSEHRGNYKDLVSGLCQDLLQDTTLLSSLSSRDCEFIRACAEEKEESFTVMDPTQPYALASRRSDRQEHNGIHLRWMQENSNCDIKDISSKDETIYSRNFYTDLDAESLWIKQRSKNKSDEALSHHKISYPNISKETAIKCRVWALWMVRLLPHLLDYEWPTPDGRENITGVRNYYLPDQQIHTRDKDLAIALCHALEAVLK